MAAQARDLIAELRAEVLALQEAAIADGIAANAATAAAATAATAATAAALAAVAPPAPVFTLAPALANNAAFLDLTSSSGAKHFKGATEALKSQPFDFSDDSDLQVFLDLVLTKSQVWGWNSILTIPVLDVATGTTTNYNLQTQYGMIPIASVRLHVLSYYSTSTKRAQDSFMSCQCFLNSLTLDFLKVIAADLETYHLPAVVAVNGDIPAGPLLLKIIISQAHVDSRATVSFIRDSLQLLHVKMIELDSNVIEFNLYVNAQINKLAHRGETSDDLLINLFKGYKAANDVEFVDLIRRKKNDYEEGKDVNVKNLMVDMLAKYRARVLTKEWSAPTKEQEQIIALSAQIDQLKSRKSPSTKVKRPAETGTPKKPKKDNKWAWKDVLPTGNQPTTKVFEGKDYHVNCPYHKNQWVCHTAEECSKNPANASAGGRPNSPAVTPGARRLQAAQLAASLLEDDEDFDEEDDEVDDP